MKKMFAPRLLLALPVLALAPSCATLISGTSQAVTIDSNVQGAEVTIEGNLVGVTPYAGKIKRQREAIAIVSADGYAAQPITLTTSYNPVAILSIFWDYSTTDCLTGAVWEYSPNSYYVNLKPAGTADAAFKKNSNLKAFAMTYQPEIMLELAAGGGPRIASMHAPYESELSVDEFVRKLQTIKTSDTVVFGEAVAEIVSD